VRNALVVGSEPERDAFGLWSVTAALALATVYWLVVAETFREEVMIDLAGVSGYAMMALAWIALLVMFLVARLLHRRRTVPIVPPFWGARLLGLSLVVYFAVAVTVVMVVGVFGFPGTDIEPGGDMVLYTLPTVAAFGLIVGASDVVLRRQGGHVPMAWVIAITGSFLIVVLLQNRILVPYRHIPYMVEAASVLIGFGAVHLFAMLRPHLDPGRPPVRHRAMAATIAVVMVAGLALTAYPPKAVMGGFQEGTTESELDATLWLGGGLPFPGADIEDLSSGTVATDHRLSSMAFGLGDSMATWDTAGPVLHGEPDDPDLWDALEDIDTPHGDRPVTAVVLSEDFRTGAALSQFESARPVEGAAWDKFSEPPFLRVYDGGDVQVLYVMRPLDTTGEL
ncbi:MAG: hypothetical protein JSW25_08535, partial [Thermoplasmata archaeon]